MTPAGPVTGSSTTGALLKPDDLDTLARTLYGEARGEPELGQIAVAWVVRNRAEHPDRAAARWGAPSIAGVCQRRFQFTCWNESDPNRARLLALDKNSALYLRLYDVASRVLLSEVPDPTNSATFYRVIGWPASWANGRKPVATIGRHEFFKLGPSE